MKTDRRSNQGFTIIELMVVVALSSFMLLGIIQVFSANSQSFRFSSAFARMQENGQLALEEISRDIRMAGYIGCASRQQIAINVVATSASCRARAHAPSAARGLRCCCALERFANS